MRKLNTSRVIGQKGDLQFDGSGNHTIDLVANGADKLIQKNDKSVVLRYKKLVQDSYQQDPALTLKIGRYFRDDENGQNLKEQPLLMLAVLDGQITDEEIQSVLTVHPLRTQDGARPLDETPLLELVKILAWHKYLNSKDSKLSPDMLSVWAKIFKVKADENIDNLLAEVIKLKNTRVQYDTENKLQVGIVDVIGIIRNRADFPKAVKDEYAGYLYPLKRGQNYKARPVSEVAKKWNKFFKGELSENEVPQGIDFLKALNSKNKAACLKLLQEGKISNAQLKINLKNIVELVGEDEVTKLITKRNWNLFPHDILAMGMAFYQGTAHTGKSAAKANMAEIMFGKLLAEYKTKVKNSVLFFADVSGSMCQPLSKKSTINQDDFAFFMSFFAANVSDHKVLAQFGSTAHLMECSKNPTLKEFIETPRAGDCSTNMYGCVVEVANYFKKVKKQAPKVLAFISDMQFDSCARPHYSSNKSNTVSAALLYYEQTTGVKPQLVFWNVAASTVPATEQDGVLLLSGFSANTADIVFGIINTSTEENRQMSTQDLLNSINNTYQ